MENRTWPTGLGAIIAVIVLMLSVVLFFVGQLEMLDAVLFGLLALARLL
jgi:4-amino-4-deoxy-L-arabinose transferase-like glycosyltransferase